MHFSIHEASMHQVNIGGCPMPAKFPDYGRKNHPNLRMPSASDVQDSMKFSSKWMSQILLYQEEHANYNADAAQRPDSNAAEPEREPHKPPEQLKLFLTLPEATSIFSESR